MKPTIALDLRGTNNAEVVIDADHYTTCMTDNPMFTDADTVALVTTTITATARMREAVAAPVSATKTDNIRIARDALDRSITSLAAKVQNIANAPENPDLVRLDIIHSAGMSEKGQARRQNNQFTVKNSDISGTVRLTAKGGTNAHEWQYTADVVNLKDRIAAPSTTTAKTEITNLEEATKYAFFHKAITVGTVTDWEGPAFLVVM